MSAQSRQLPARAITRLVSSALMMGLVVYGAHTANLASAQEPVGTEAADFTGALLRQHSYLLSDPQRTALDPINRQLREARQRAEEAENDAARQQANDARVAAEQELTKLLAAFSRVLPVSWDDAIDRAAFAKAYALPGDMGGVIFRIQAGEGGTRFVTYDIDLAERSGKIDIACAPAGTTWALVGLSHVPLKRTSLRFEFDRAGMPSFGTVLDVTTPDNGQLQVSVMSADTHEPAPAMVRLVWKTNGVDRKPSTAVELSSLFDGQGHASGRRRPNLPGALGEWFWCVAKPFRMALPPGDYEITISRGVEHVPISDSFHVTAGELIEKSYEPQRWVDMRQLGWYSGDDHVHGQILSDADAERLMAWVQAEDIHVANIVKMGDIHRTWFEQRGFGPAHRVIDRDYVLVPGQECPRTHDEIGHTLAMNITSMVRDTDQYFLYDRVADAVHAQGGLWGYAHVNSGIFHVHRDMSMNVPQGKCDFAEVLQFQQLGTDLYYDFLNLGCKITASAGSDVPWGGSVGEVRLYAHVGKQSFAPDVWFDAVRRGRTFVTSGPMIELHVDDALPGDEIVVASDRNLQVKTRAWGHPERMVPTRLEIVCHGEVIRSAESADLAVRELTLECELPAGHGYWIAARAVANDGTTAHTTPVYVVRQGLRFWKFDAVNELIAQREASLDEIEQLVVDARERVAAGDAEGERTDQQLAAQGPELLQRVAQARSLYAQLKQIATREAAIRGVAR